jgi:hypothetical protein
MTEPLDASEINAIQWADPLKTRGWVQSGGLVVVPAALHTLNTTIPRAFQAWLEFFSAQPQEVELEVQTQAQPVPIPDGFPDGTNTATARAGAFSLGGTWDSNPGNSDIIVAKYETGSGVDARVFFGDVRPGRFSLGVQQRVRISVARWLRAAGTADSQYVVQGSIGPARGTDADPITYTCATNILAAGESFLQAPPGALYWWVDLANGLGPFDGSILMVVDGQAQFSRTIDPAAPVQSPPGCPWPFPAGPGQVHFINTGASNLDVVVTFWVR